MILQTYLARQDLTPLPREGSIVKLSTIGSLSLEMSYAFAIATRTLPWYGNDALVWYSGLMEYTKA